MTKASPYSQEAFINYMLAHVPFDGWTQNAMQNTASELGISDQELASLFPRGLIELIEVGARDLDTKMVSSFMEHYGDQVGQMPIHIKIRELLLIRFEIIKPNKEAVRKLMTLMSRPDMAKSGSAILYNTLDRIWRVAGDQSTDFNFYTKRATLGAVYGSTMLAFLDDDSEDLQKTRAFLDRRLADISKIPKTMQPIKRFTALASNIFNAVNPLGRRG